MFTEEDLVEITHIANITLVLVAVERIMEKFHEQEDMYRVTSQVIEAGKSWLQTRNPTPEQLYWEYSPKLMEIDSLPEVHRIYEEKPYVQYAFHALIYAHLITVWLSEAVERLEEPVKVYSIGNDIAEVSYSYLTECLDNCIKASVVPEQMEAWLQRAVARLSQYHNCSQKGYIGGLVAAELLL